MLIDHKAAVERNLPIMSAITAVNLPDGTSILMVIHEGIYNETANLVRKDHLHSMSCK